MLHVKIKVVSNSDWFVNGKPLFGSFNWKFPGAGGCLKR